EEAAHGAGVRRAGHLAVAEHRFLGPQRKSRDGRLLIRLLSDVALLHSRAPFQCMLHEPHEPVAQLAAGASSGTVAMMSAMSPRWRARTSSAMCSISRRCEPVTQYSQSPCSRTSTPKTSARRCAVLQRKSTGASGSPFSSSAVAAHEPHSERSAHELHFVTRVFGRSRTWRRNISQPSRTVPLRTLYVSTCDSTQMVMLP